MFINYETSVSAKAAPQKTSVIIQLNSDSLFIQFCSISVSVTVH